MVVEVSPGAGNPEPVARVGPQLHIDRHALVFGRCSLCFHDHSSDDQALRPLLLSL